MSTIRNVHVVPIQGAYYYDDITALQARSLPEEERWNAPAVTPGFRFVREVAEAVSIGIELHSGDIAWGDCVAVSYCGKAGREMVFRSGSGMESIRENVIPRLLGKDATVFREWMPLLEDQSLHSAIRYGVSQALLASAASCQKRTMTEILCREWNIPLPTREVPLQGSCGNDRYSNVDKMIVQRLEALPHGQIDNIEKQLGNNGEVLLDYARWLVHRIGELAGGDYYPTIHFDVHGAVGKIFQNDTRRVVDYLGSLYRICQPFPLRVESVVVRETREDQLEALEAIHSELHRIGLPVTLVVDEWANSRQDIMYFAESGAVDMVHVKMPDLGSIHESLLAVRGCQKLGVKTLLGGSCIETELSTRASLHVALASEPTVFLAKPGMGVNEAIMLCRNEMRRTIATLNLA
jgi:methylaspartate ammonia-lyase